MPLQMIATNSPIICCMLIVLEYFYWKIYGTKIYWIVTLFYLKVVAFFEMIIFQKLVNKY